MKKSTKYYIVAGYIVAKKEFGKEIKDYCFEEGKWEEVSWWTEDPNTPDSVPLKGDNLCELPPITPHICRHTYCSNMAKMGMSPKSLQYLMGHSDFGVTLNVYTHLGLEDAKAELERFFA